MMNLFAQSQLPGCVEFLGPVDRDAVGRATEPAAQQRDARGVRAEVDVEVVSADSLPADGGADTPRPGRSGARSGPAPSCLSQADCRGQRCQPAPWASHRIGDQSPGQAPGPASRM